jgi:hypothetical protein
MRSTVRYWASTFKFRGATSRSGSLAMLAAIRRASSPWAHLCRLYKIVVLLTSNLYAEKISLEPTRLSGSNAAFRI